MSRMLKRVRKMMLERESTMHMKMILLVIGLDCATLRPTMKLTFRLVTAIIIS